MKVKEEEELLTKFALRFRSPDEKFQAAHCNAKMMWKCWGSEPTVKKEFLRCFWCKKVFFYYSMGTGPVGRKDCTGIVRNN